MTLEQKDIKKIAEILHQIYCGRDHEDRMEAYDLTQKCKFYLEGSIDRTWELESHAEWLGQAHALVAMSKPLDVREVLQDIVQVYQISERLKGVNPKLAEYVKLILR